MNLYKIRVVHAAPKDSHESIQCYIVAQNDEQVYEWLKSNPTIDDIYMGTGWEAQEEENEAFEIRDANFNLIGTESYKGKIIRLKGEIEDDDADWNDLYYGKTFYSWEKVKEISEKQLIMLIDVNVVKKVIGEENES